MLRIGFLHTSGSLDGHNSRTNVNVHYNRRKYPSAIVFLCKAKFFSSFSPLHMVRVSPALSWCNPLPYIYIYMYIFGSISFTLFDLSRLDILLLALIQKSPGPPSSSTQCPISFCATTVEKTKQERLRFRDAHHCRELAAFPRSECTAS